MAVCGAGDVVQNTLSMNGFVFDAMLKDGVHMKEDIIEIICKQYNNMILEGATTCWETLEGESAFDNAGSLCHGWSALPIYYCHILNV